MAFDVTCVESMQWNRTLLLPKHEGDGDEVQAKPVEIAPEILAQVQEAISAEVAKVAV